MLVFPDLEPDETELIGQWILVDGEVDGDDACLRIQYLVSERLKKPGKDRRGWETLFRDPRDGRYWERTYPNSSWHGGGPPALISLTEAQARAKYPSFS
jgi:hypothetical protein